MEVNHVPKADLTDNPTGCCPRFHPEVWQDQTLHFQDKLFVKAKTRCLFHIPLNFASVFTDTLAAIEAADAQPEDEWLVLSIDPSPWVGEHYFSVDHDVPGQEMVKLSGDYLVKVFEGPFKEAPKWQKAMAEYVASKGKNMKKNFFYYTTCPKCAEAYGKNYVVAVAEVA
jgi:hypothetical protein